MTHERLNREPDRARDLPIDADLGGRVPAVHSPRPVHLHWKSIGLVFLGGAIGTGVRYLLSAAIPAWHGLDIATLAINVTGAFLLGWLLETLSHGGADQGARRAIRLFIGTGILGGYTTYSSFAVDTDLLVAANQLGNSAFYGLATVLVGAASSAAGIMVGAAIRHARARRVAR